MSQLNVTLRLDDDRTLTLPFEQVLGIQRAQALLERNGREVYWHPNECGCCVTVHPADAPEFGCVIDSRGEGEWRRSSGDGGTVPVVNIEHHLKNTRG